MAEVESSWSARLVYWVLTRFLLDSYWIPVGRDWPGGYPRAQATHIICMMPGTWPAPQSAAAKGQAGPGWANLFGRPAEHGAAFLSNTDGTRNHCDGCRI